MSDASLDLLGAGDTPRLMFRLESPTSNLGVSGSQIEDPFFNQRALLLGRLPGFDLDLRYRRMRTEDMRVFPNTADAGLLFDDRSGRHQRFDVERTGFDAELRARMDELLDSADWLRQIGAPELSLRGGYEAREGDRQLRFLIDPTNQWIGLAQGRDQEVGDVGGGAAAGASSPVHARLRLRLPELPRERVGRSCRARSAAASRRPTTRSTSSRIRIATPAARASGASSGSGPCSRADSSSPCSSRRTTSRPPRTPPGCATTACTTTRRTSPPTSHLIGAFSANGYFKFDERDNDIERNTAAVRGRQRQPGGRVHPPLETAAGRHRGRLPHRRGQPRGARRALRVIHRDRDFAQPDCPLNCFPAILPVNALVHEDTESYTIYARSALRLLRRIGVQGELGYRLSPDIGYVTDLDDYVYGKLRASYTLPVERSVVLSLFAQGGSGENRSQVMVERRRHRHASDRTRSAPALRPPGLARGRHGERFALGPGRPVRLVLRVAGCAGLRARALEPAALRAAARPRDLQQRGDRGLRQRTVERRARQPRPDRRADGCGAVGLLHTRLHALQPGRLARSSRW